MGKNKDAAEASLDVHKNFNKLTGRNAEGKVLLR